MRILALIASASVLAGCIGDEPVVSTEIPPPECEDADDCPAECPDEAGCLPPEVPSTVNVTRFDGNLALAVGTPVVAANPTGQDAFLFSFEVPEGTTGVVVEMVWTPNSPSATSLRMSYDAKDAGFADESVATAEGPSPLRIALGPDAVTPGEYQTRTFAASSGGLAQDQDFTVYLSLFAGEGPADAYTAVPPAP